MKASKIILTIFIVTALISCNRTTTEVDQTVNAVIGDISYLESFDIAPTTETNEVLRLKTHLKYVESLLRNKDISGLTEEQKDNRQKMLDLLKDYWTAGVFPKNYDYQNKRTPCFIDKSGRICALGYLIEQTAGRQIAEKINSKYKHEYLLAIKDDIIDNWIHLSGLTKKECAMIQPTYGPLPTDNHITPAYGVSTSLLSGINLSLNTINGIQLSKEGSNSKAAPILGIITGAGQITLGAVNFPEEQRTMGGILVNESQRTFSLINIGLGASTMVLSSWNLFKNREPKEKSFSWNIYGYPVQNSNMGFGFSLTKRL